jgi:hypothetical protein
MDEKEVRFPTAEELGTAARFALHEAILVDVDEPLGEFKYRVRHERWRRFVNAHTLVMSGLFTSLSDLGLTHTDCHWAACQVARVQDKKIWFFHFLEAECYLRIAFHNQVRSAFMKPQFLHA